MAASTAWLIRAVVQGWRFCVVAGVGRIHGFMTVFGLNSCLRWLVLQLAGRHLRGHRVAYPAAQGQQGDQDGEEQMAHG